MTSNILPTPDLTVQRAESLADRAVGASAQQAREIADDFESLFVALLLKEMRQSVSEDGLFAGEGSDTYGAMFDMYMGEHLAKSGDFGIGEMAARYLEQGKPS